MVRLVADKRFKTSCSCGDSESFDTREEAVDYSDRHLLDVHGVDVLISPDRRKN